MKRKFANRAAETRAKILKEARKLIQQSGYEKVRLDDLLEKMALSKGGFYHHFKSVEELLAALIREDFRKDFLAIETASAIPDSREALLEVFRIGSVHLDNQAGILLHLHSTKNRQLYLGLMNEAWYDPFKTILTRLLERGMNQGELPQFDIDVTVELFEAINRHSNRAEVLGLWSSDLALAYARSAMDLLAQRLKMQKEFNKLKSGLK